MRGQEVNMQIPGGTYNIGVKMLFALWKWRFEIGSEKQVTLTEGKQTKIQIKDKERWWNILFNLDLAFWITSFFFTLPEPWDMWYHILSEGFFALWLARIWFIRKRYFQFIEETT